MKKNSKLAKVGAVAMAAVVVLFSTGGKASAGDFNSSFQKGYNDPFYGVKSWWRSVKRWF